MFELKELKKGDPKLMNLTKSNQLKFQEHQGQFNALNLNQKTCGRRKN